ncbi:probable glucuronosyltransferase Os03g0107900 [Asparagus officinalis]|nr:probable glucuronosyltransferase Os03g0107900 [Asparagus officinalis]
MQPTPKPTAQENNFPNYPSSSQLKLNPFPPLPSSSLLIRTLLLHDALLGSVRLLPSPPLLHRILCSSPSPLFPSSSLLRRILSSSPFPLLLDPLIGSVRPLPLLPEPPSPPLPSSVAEVAIHEALLTSGFRTTSPDEADFFFVPVYVSCNFSTVNGFPSLAHARPLIASSIAEIKTKYPFWNRTNGRDHMFVASHDYGACFHAMEDVAIADGIPEFLRRSILLQTFGVTSPHVCQEAEHVLIPPYIPPGILRSPPPETARRDIFVFFRGKMEVHPKNISGRFCSK